jgi:DNA (cytosine-5)-methyltransferase 1
MECLHIGVRPRSDRELVDHEVFFTLPSLWRFRDRTHDSRLSVRDSHALIKDYSSGSVVGLFAGIGGFEVAFAKSDFATSLFAEIDPAAQTVLRDKFPGSQVIDDVKDIDVLPAGTSIVTAGFPCQNLSMAGDKSGIGGAKSGVVDKLFDILERSRASTVVIENVYFMLHLDRGRGMNWLLDRFEELGYRWAYRVLDTSGFGLPHRRRRVYLVATQDIDPRSILFADDEGAAEPEPRSILRPLGFYWTEGRSGVGITVDGIPPLKSGSSLGIPSAPAVLFPDGAVLMPSIAACEALQGFPPGWTDAVRSLRRDPRWRLLGNAVSVPAAAWVASRIKDPGDVLKLDCRRLELGSPWPNAAFNVGEGRHGVKIGSKPLAEPVLSIESYRDDSWTVLSDRALTGFLKRAHEGNLRFPEGFLDALHANLNQRNPHNS